MSYILILYYSRHGSVKQLAKYIAMGVESCNIEARIRTVPSISPNTEQTEKEIPEEGAIYASLDDLANCSGLALGSPSRFGNIAAPLKYFLDSTSKLWANGALDGKPASTFTSSSSMHGGQETTQLSMYMPLLHHGMLMVGISPKESGLYTTNQGGTPYGASHVTGKDNDNSFSKEEKEIAINLGKRLATITKKLS